MMKILLIEDNDDHAELIQRSLENGLGRIRVTLTHNAREAYRLLNNHNFDLILSDYYLSDAKGESHIRQLYKIAPSIPIVVITGQGDEKIAARSIKAGAEDYVVKTRDVLAALPGILKRAILKLNSRQNKKKREMQKHLSHQKETVKKVLGEVNAIDRRMKRLKTQVRKPVRRSRRDSNTAVEHVVQQIENLRKFVKKMFSGGH